MKASSYFLKAVVIAICLNLAIAPAVQAMQELKRLDATKKTQRRVSRCLHISSTVGTLWAWYQAYHFFLPENETAVYKFALGIDIGSKAIFTSFCTYIFGNNLNVTHYAKKQSNLLQTICTKLTAQELDIAQIPIKDLWPLFEHALKANDHNALALIQPRCAEIPNGTEKVINLYEQELRTGGEAFLPPLLITSLKYFPRALFDIYVRRRMSFELATQLYKEMVAEGLLAAGYTVPAAILTLVTEY